MSDLDELVGILARIFENLGITYWIGGSMASIAYGYPRLTQDIDLVAAIGQEHVDRLKAALGEDFYADMDMMRSAINSQSSFNVIYLPTMMKVDLFIMQDTAWAREEQTRRQLRPVGVGSAATAVYVASPEDMILQKLKWYRMTGERSDRQWGDVQGILKVQADALDFVYLRRWAIELQLTDLLDAALSDAGVAARGEEAAGDTAE